MSEKAEEIPVIVIGSSNRGDEFDYEKLEEVLYDYAIDYHVKGIPYHYRIIQTGEPDGTAAMARKYAAGTIPPMQDQKNVCCDLQEWRKSKDNGLEMLCLAFLAADDTDDGTWKIIREQIKKGTEIRLY